MRFSSALVAISTPFLVAAAPIKWSRQDADLNVAVIKFAEVLERLETQFYQEALDKFTADDFTAAGISVPDVAIQNFQQILAHETAHTEFLNRALADLNEEPIQGCSFNFDAVLGDVQTMAAVARVVEAAGVGAYLGGAQLISDGNVLAAAASILTIEARHQSFLNTINGGTNTAQAFDIALTPEQVLSLAGGFVSGCDVSAELGLPPANPALSITNTGTVAAGTRLEFSSEVLADGNANISCQMMVGGQPTSISFPIEECIVPDGINGQVVIFLTNSEQPLATDVKVRATADIVAGPTIAYIDSEPDALGALLRNGSPPIDSSEEISPDEAQDELDDATTTDGGNDATETDGGDDATETDGGDDATETDGGDDATETSSSDAPTNTSTPQNSSNGPVTPAIKEIGVSFIPA